MTQPPLVLPRTEHPVQFAAQPLQVPPVIQPVRREQFLTRWLLYFRGIGPRRVHALQKAGVTDWAQLTDSLWLLPRGFRSQVRRDLEAALEALTRQDATYFLARLPRPEHWRVAAAFPDRTTFLDIETTGLSRHYHQLTIIGWAFNGRFNVHIKGDQQQGIKELVHDLNRTAVLVTFNGAHFDLPFLKAHVPDLKFPTAHVDLRHLSRRVGATGGQKKVELELCVQRHTTLRKISGADAPALWFKYQRGDLEALELLLRYNHADVEGLRLILAAVASRTEPDLPVDWKSAPLNILSTNDVSPTVPVASVSVRPYVGVVGPRLKVSDLPNSHHLKVVGIDLSGSERRTTGWAVVRGTQGCTKPLRTDADIISATLDARPDLISIDAPLSLPIGRKQVEDSDPGRVQYGITRECERILRRRGVSTYPCLIRSMQALTSRGISIATQLRAHGLPVIESFPGAMQDILGMPRKGISLDLLKTAVSEYGITGNFLGAGTTHDEIDALCSSIVGQMFWAGHYEALGNEQEDYLIVPSLDKIGEAAELVIGISGYTGSGKTTLSRHLASVGFAAVGFSEILEELFPRKDGRRLNRAQLQRLGESVHVDPGQRWLDQQVLGVAKQYKLAVIDGIRFPEDHAFMVERLGPRFVHVHVTAPSHLRRTRFIERGGTEEMYRNALISPTESQVGRLRDIVHVELENDRGLQELKLLIDAELNQLNLRSFDGCR